MPSATQRRLFLGQSFNPYSLPNTAARYSLDGSASDATYLIDGSNRLMLVADRSGNSATNGLVLNATNSNYASSPDAAPLRITGDIDLRGYGILATWTPAANMTFVAKRTDGGNQAGYWLDVNTAGKISFGWSPTGAIGASITVVSTVVIPFAAYAVGGIRATLDVDNGASGYTVTFYTSTDFVTWTQLGATVVGGATTSIANVTSGATCGAVNAGTGSPLGGIIYRAQIYNGIAGTLAFDANFTLPAKLASSFTESSSNAATVTINTSGDTGARICGARDAVQMTQTKQPIFTASAAGNYATGDGVDDFMASAAFSLSQPESVYLVFSGVTLTVSKYWSDGFAVNSGAINYATSKLNAYAGVDLPLAALSAGVRYLARVVFNGASSSIATNRNAATTGNAGSANLGGFRLFAAGNDTQHSNSTFSEALVRSVADDAALQQKIAQYMIRKWGITP